VSDGFRIDRIEFDKNGLEDALVRNPAIALVLREIAEDRIKRASYHGATFRVWAGVGKKRGAYAQGVMYHPRARFIEFGTRKAAPRAVLRRAFGIV
jgi:hypothetical protein